MFESDDWSFIIGVHALIEGAVSQMLTAAVDPRLEPLFVKMGLNGRFGKLAFAKHLELLDQKVLNFVNVISGVRNTLAHGLNYLDFTIDGHLRGLKAQDKERFFGALESMPATTERSAWASECRAEPKACILKCTVALIREVLDTGAFYKIDREEAQHALMEMIEGRTVPYQSWMDPDQ